MSKYALVISADAGLLPGVHGMLNALKYYGDFDSGELEFHLLYWPSEAMSTFIAKMQESGHFPSFKAINLRDMIRPYDRKQGLRPVYFLKFYRSLYAGELIDYNAVAFFDADRIITDSIYDYFGVAEKTGKILMPDYKYQQERYDNGFYRKHCIQATNGCPYDPSATFFTPSMKPNRDYSTYGEYFTRVHKLGKEVVKRSEMPTVNYVLITRDLLPHVLPLDTDTWNWRKIHTRQMDWLKCKDGIYRVIFGDTGETVKTIHGRWHIRGALIKKAADAELIARKPWGRTQNHNINQIWKSFAFFNFGCYTTIDWIPKWATQYEYIDIDTGDLVESDVPIWELDDA